MIISNLPVDLGRVKQNYSTDNENRPLLMSGVAGVTFLKSILRIWRIFLGL